MSEEKYQQKLIVDNNYEMPEYLSDDQVRSQANTKPQYIINEQFIDSNGTKARTKNCCQRLCCCFREDFNTERWVSLDGKSQPYNNISNAVNNQKYNIINFIPLVLFNQFKLFFNFFQLAICLSQLIPILKVGFLFTYLSPLVMVMALTLAKQAYDDLKRYKRDSQVNSTKYQIINRNGYQISKQACKIKVGNIIMIHAKQRIPADVVVLSTSQPTGSIFIKTDQLDGQTDWKVRRAIRTTHNMLTNNIPVQGSINYAPACDDIYDFIGSYTDSEGNKQSLNLQNTAWANTVLAAGHLIGLVIFTGHQTRANKNSRQPCSKIGKFDEEINYLSKVLFILMLGLALIMNVFRITQYVWFWFLYYFRYVLLLASIIPISLRVNLDFCKAYFSYKISNDDEIPGTVCRNSSIPEELGRVEYLLSDKTGTLTYNDMVFKKLSVNEQLYNVEDMEDIRKGIIKACRKFEGPLGDLHDAQLQKKKLKRRQQFLLRDMATALILCNNVTPVNDEGLRVLQASSPDEIALVKFAEQLGFLLLNREQNLFTITNPAEEEQKYEILANFPFSSETKLMGIIVRHVKTGRIILYLKGADMVMIEKCKAIHRGYIQDECDNLARQGLRTLVITQKQIQQTAFDQWNSSYQQASNLLKNRHQNMQNQVQKLQNNMELVGITGVQDKLQDEVTATIQALRMGGIKIWMLTGDKVETAKCIAISAGIKNVHQEIYEVRGEDELLIRTRLNDYDYVEQVLLIDGPALTSILNTNNSSLFFEVARKAPAVICCRCLPTQKALITQKLKQMTQTIMYAQQFIHSAGIGDGGNDVGMIQLASIGLGIVGKQGNHAALASDVSMKQFKYIKNILLWHGRNAYKRAATLSQFVIHRGLIISILQMCFSIIFYNVAIPIYNGMLMLGYATLYTSLPVFSLILDLDLSLQKVLMYPNLYISLRKSRDMNLKTFFIWVWISIYQGVVIMIGSLRVFDQSFVGIVTITFTALIMSEILNVVTTIHRFSWYIFGSMILTLLLYWLSLIFFKNYLDTSRIDLIFLILVTAIVMFSWLPIFIVKFTIRKVLPSQEDKITH